MSHQNPSIQSFFPPTKPGCSSSPSGCASSPISAGDGFTSSEVASVLNPPVDAPWYPEKEYEELEIASLEPGPHRVTFQGRIVNLYEQTTGTKRVRGAKGCLKLLVKDDTGCLTVKLWYANLDYKSRIGHLVSIWTTHISNGEHGNFSSPVAPLYTSIFAERDRNAHFMIHENSDDGTVCKKPLDFHDGHALRGLMTLRNYVDGGHEVDDGKILVCVKSIGAKKKITSKKQKTSELVNVHVFDDTAEAVLPLWSVVANTAATWKCSHTVLLLTNAGCEHGNRNSISLNSNTLIDVDPDMADADWLRSFAQRTTRREHVNPPFPTTFDIEAACSAQNQTLFNFGDVDDFARAMPSATDSFSGLLSVLLTDLRIVLMQQRNMLMCNECCGVPMYANSEVARCKQCDNEVKLGINPRILGPVIDETGQISSGKLLLSPEAWTQLLGLTPQQLCESTSEALCLLESRICFLRVTLRFV